MTTHLGAMLTLYRAARRCSARDLAPQVGISHATLSRIERGQTMDAATLLKVWAWLMHDDPATQGEAPL